MACERHSACLLGVFSCRVFAHISIETAVVNLYPAAVVKMKGAARVGVVARTCLRISAGKLQSLQYNLLCFVAVLGVRLDGDYALGISCICNTVTVYVTRKYGSRSRRICRGVMRRTRKVGCEAADERTAFLQDFQRLVNNVCSTCEVICMDVRTGITHFLAESVQRHRIVPREPILRAFSVGSYEIICGKRRCRSGHKSRD